jgi:hypothetical protein
VDELSNVQNWPESEKQINEIISEAKKYQEEADRDFVAFCKLNMIPLSSIEPFYRRALVINECHQDHLRRALSLTEELQQKFPEWSKRDGITEVIAHLRLGKSPYQKMPPF